MFRSILATITLGIVEMAAINVAPAFAATYKYKTFSITLNPPGQLSVTGIDSAGDVVGNVNNLYKNKSGEEVAFAYVNGKIKLANQIGDGNSFAPSLGSNGVAVLERIKAGKSHFSFLKWDIITNKKSQLYSPGAPKLGLIQYSNASVDLVGLCDGGACFDSGTELTLMNPSAYSGASVFGVNDAGLAAGTYDYLSGENVVNALYTYQNGVTNTINVPGNTNISGTGGVSSNGEIVGSYSTSSGSSGFLLVGGNLTSFSYPGAKDTGAVGVNASGQIIGLYYGPGSLAPFLYQNGKFYPINIPNGTNVSPTFINDQGTITGSYTPVNSTYAVGFVATCKAGPGKCTP